MTDTIKSASQLPSPQQGAAVSTGGGSPSSSPAPSSLSPQMEFLRSIAAPALACQEKYGVPAGVTMAQAVLESAWGRSRLFREANNPFGHKNRANAQPGLGAYRALTTEYLNGKVRKVYANFAMYTNLAAAFDAHGKLLNHPRYAPVRAAADVPSACEALQECGYASDPNYAAKLKSIVAQHRLYDIAKLRGLARGKEPA